MKSQRPFKKIMLSFDNFWEISLGHRFIQDLGFLLIGLYVLGISTSQSNFAEIHFKFSSLNFPVFIGEIILFFCLVLWLINWVSFSRRLTVWGMIWIGYLGFVLIKALTGYAAHGPLAFRHAALFYYPLFAVYGYSFFRSGLFDDFKKVLLIAFFLFIMRGIPSRSLFFFYGYLALGFTFLSLALAFKCSHKVLRVCLIGGIVIMAPYFLIFDTSRSMLCGNIAGILYLAICLLSIWDRLARWKIFSLGFLAIVLLLSVNKWMDSNAMKTMLNFKRIQRSFMDYDKIAKERSRTHPDRIPVSFQIYNPNTVKKGLPVPADRVPDIKPVRKDLVSKSTSPVPSAGTPGGGPAKVSQTQEPKRPVSKQGNIEVFQGQESNRSASKQGNIEQWGFPTMKQEDVGEMRHSISSQGNIEEANRPVLKRGDIEELRYSKLKQKNAGESNSPGLNQGNIGELYHLILVQKKVEAGKKKEDLRDPVTAENNILFRLFIWRDILQEIREEKIMNKLAGTDFGKPFISITLERLVWGYRDWARDGWVSEHNSFLNIFYRAGVVGLFMIFMILAVWVRLAVVFCQQRDISGIFLTAIFLEWMVAANFLPILELPYNAIFLWSLAGMTLAYGQRKGYNFRLDIFNRKRKNYATQKEKSSRHRR